MENPKDNPTTERPSPPVLAEDRRDPKKAQGVGEEDSVMDLHESVSDMETDCTDNNPGFEEQGIRARNTYRIRVANSPGKTTYASMVKKGSNGFGCESYDEELSPDKVIVLDDDCIVSDSGEFLSIVATKKNS
ncbi:hypothetical protein V6N13_087861 [Hibiscus sabdariffa]|uniref:Uncharacterized protein n=1 Tax=Hibiscus sabdariffa TaxID=183260 RepID=A0ABR2FYE4_9ROSI